MKKLIESRGEISFHGGFLANLVYVGDLCYCLNDAVYQEAIELADYEGKFDSTVSGMHVEGAFVSTQYGDGSYIGSDSREYAVDAGIIGIANITSAAATDGEDFESFSKLGRVIKLPKYGPTQYEISRDEDGTITVEIRQGRFKEVIAIVTGDTEEEEEDTEICPCCGAEYDGYECTRCGYPESFGEDEEEFEESVISEAAEKKSIKDWIESEMTDEVKEDVYEFLRCSDKYYLDDFVTEKQFENIMFNNGFDDQRWMWKPLMQESKSDTAFLKKAAKIAKVEIACIEYFKNKDDWMVVLNSEDSYDADRFRNVVDSLLDANSGEYSYDDIEGLGDVHLGTAEYSEVSEDAYSDLNPDWRDKVVVYCEPSKRYKARRAIDY